MHTYIKNVVTGLPCVCLSVMIGTDRRPSCLSFCHLPAHACCGQMAEAVSQFQRAVAKALKLGHDVDVTVAEDYLMVALFPVRGPLPAATVGTSRHARCACTAEARLRR